MGVSGPSPLIESMIINARDRECASSSMLNNYYHFFFWGGGGGGGWGGRSAKVIIFLCRIFRRTTAYV